MNSITSQAFSHNQKKYTYNIAGNLEVSITVQRNPFDLPLDTLFKMAARINKKRSFLFVSKVLGKHIPVNPHVSLLAGASLSLFRKVILPASVPTIFVGIRQAGASSILVLVAAEMVGAKEGLGYLIQYTQFSFQIPEMYAGIISISVIGVIINFLLVLLEKRLTSWKQSYSE